jgi:hypothetical protein
MFCKVEDLAEILPLIRSHHEAFDGSGFPDGLRGDAIPLGARLIAIADHLEKSAHSVERNRAQYAVMNAHYQAGKQFDPQLIGLFQDILKIVYVEGRSVGGVSEVEIDPEELVPGMVIARDVQSVGGVLLMQGGNRVDVAGIALIRSHYRKSPPSNGVFVRIVEE